VRRITGEDLAVEQDQIRSRLLRMWDAKQRTPMHISKTMTHLFSNVTYLQ
jgi:hypothetical protein